MGKQYNNSFTKVWQQKTAGYREDLGPAFPSHIHTSGTSQNLFHGIKQQTEKQRHESVMK